jgi:hypothetical protein
MNQNDLVTQEHSMGCAVACVASICGLTYQSALQLFDQSHLAWTRGYYCPEIVHALKKANFNYAFKELDTEDFSNELVSSGAIVFVAPNFKYPSGHFLLKTEMGWMNPWSNFPDMNPPKSKYEKNLPGVGSFIIFRES